MVSRIIRIRFHLPVHQHDIERIPQPTYVNQVQAPTSAGLISIMDLLMELFMVLFRAFDARQAPLLGRIKGTSILGYTIVHLRNGIGEIRDLLVL